MCRFGFMMHIYGCMMGFCWYMWMCDGYMRVNFDGVYMYV